MKHHPLLVAIAAAALLVCGLAHAEVLHNGRVYRTTADRIIEAERLTCAYGAWQQSTLRNGATVISRGKVCQRGDK